MEQINLNAAGVDIGDAEIWVCVPSDRDEMPVRCFPTFTGDLHRLADWLTGCDVDTVAMEATGVYWIALYELLETRGFDVNLINARHLKNVAAQKSDVLDCQWIQKLHTYGLLRASFRPSEEICTLRSLTRHREMLVRYRAVHIQHMQKALQLMNVKLTNVLSDITGVTGMAILRAIVAGEHNPLVLAQFRQGGCKKSEQEIAKSLEGNFRREHLFALKQALELYDVYDQQIQACDAELQALYDQFDPPDTDIEPPEPSQRKRRKNQANFDLTTALYQMCGVDLTQIDGIDALTAQVILTEIGWDMSPWPTAKHFASWLRLSPCNDISGGKVLRRRTKKTANRANTALRVAAQSLARSNSALGAFYRRIRARHGPAKAVVATAHKLARIIYAMLKYRRPYVDPGARYYEERYQERVIRNLERKAARFGLVLTPAVAEVS
jgi:transposase